jgi:transcriptional regulator with XRE-family HTH domain
MRTSPTDAAIGEAIKARRTALSVSEETLAKALGMPLSEYRACEAGRTRLSASEIHRACQALDLNPKHRLSARK